MCMRAAALCAAVALIVTVGFILFALMTGFSVINIFCAIGSQPLVTGSTKFFTPAGYFDLAMLQPSVANPGVLASEKNVKDDVL